MSEHATHDPELVAAYAAGDATGSDLVAAAGLVAGCSECAALHRDLRAIMTALPKLPAPVRPRDFRLAPDQARALRPSGLRRLLAPLAGARFAFAGPAGAGLAALGLAGILLSGGLNVQPPTASTAAERSVGAPEASAAVGTSSQRFAAGPSAAPSVQPVAVDQAAPSAAAPAKGPAGLAPATPVASPKDAGPAPTAIAPTVANGAGFGPANAGGAGAGASQPPPPAVSTASTASTASASPIATSATSPTLPVAGLGFGLLVAGILLAGTRWAARRLA
jgi:hypothetical protein